MMTKDPRGSLIPALQVCFSHILWHYGSSQSCAITGALPCPICLEEEASYRSSLLAVLIIITVGGELRTSICGFLLHRRGALLPPPVSFRTSLQPRGKFDPKLEVLQHWAFLILITHGSNNSCAVPDSKETLSLKRSLRRRQSAYEPNKQVPLLLPRRHILQKTKWRRLKKKLVTS